MIEESAVCTRFEPIVRLSSTSIPPPFRKIVPLSNIPATGNFNVPLRVRLFAIARVPPAPVNCMDFDCGISNPLEIVRVTPDLMSTFDDPVCCRFCTSALFSTSIFPELSTTGTETFATVIEFSRSLLVVLSSTSEFVLAKAPPPERLSVLAPRLREGPV